MKKRLLFIALTIVLLVSLLSFPIILADSTADYTVAKDNDGHAMIVP